MRTTIFAVLVLAGTVSGQQVSQSPATPQTLQQASYTFFGGGCAPSNGAVRAPTLTVQGLPRLGQSFTVIYSGANQTGPTGGGCCQEMPLLVTGISNTSFGGMPLPWRIPDYPGSIQNPNALYGCTLRVSAEIVMAMPVVTGTRTYLDRITISVPIDPMLLGMPFLQQWFTVHLACSPGGYGGCTTSLASSLGGHGVIGY